MSLGPVAEPGSLVQVHQDPSPSSNSTWRVVVWATETASDSWVVGMVVVGELLVAVVVGGRHDGCLMSTSYVNIMELVGEGGTGGTRGQERH